MRGDLTMLTASMVRNRQLLILTVVMILVAGASALVSLPRIEDPRITTRNATIVTPFPGASAERVEALVSKPIEDRLRELSEIKTIESTSRSGISVVNIELQDWVGANDNEQIFAKVRDRLDDAASELPAGAAAPAFDDKRGAVAFSMILALAWHGEGEPQLGVLQRSAERLGDRLRNLPGTDQVVYFGAVDEEIRVDVDAKEAAALGFDLNDLAARIAAADARRSAGTLRGQRQALQVEVTGALDTGARIAAIPLGDNGRGGLVHVGDVASVSKGWADPPDTLARHNGVRSILVAVRTEEAIRLDQWADEAKLAVDAFTSDLDSAIDLNTVFDQSHYTEQRLGGLTNNLLAGAAVIMLVVWLMMGWRAALIVGAALPLSAGLSLFGLTFFGEQIHQMSIFGMIIAIGLLIDNAIVMTDRVIERRRHGDSAAEAVDGAVRHLFVPLFASTFTTILGFMPVFLLPGNVGDFVGPIAIAVILALIASFLLSMTVVPALAALLATANHEGRKNGKRNGVRSALLTARFRSLLTGAVRHPWLAIAGVSVLPITGFVLAGTLGMQFFPPADRDQLELQLWMPAGTSIHGTLARAESIERQLVDRAGVRQVTWVIGASSPPVYYNQLRDQDNNPTYARAVLQVDDTATAKRLETALQGELTAAFPDAQIVVRAFGQGPPVKSPVGFRIVGPDPERLRELGDQLREVLHRQSTVTHSQASIQGGEPKLWLVADEVEAQRAGLSLGDVAEQFQAALDGRIAGEALEDIEDLPVRIRYQDVDRRSIEALSTLRLASDSSDRWVPAVALGELELRPSLQGITRRNGQRVNEVLAFLHQDALPIEVSNRVMQEIDAGAITLPADYRIELAGDSAEQQRAVNQLLTYVPVLATLMVATLVLSFRSFALAGLIGTVAAFSIGLGMLSLWAAGFPLGFNPIIGSAGLVGVAINGSIVVLAAIRTNDRARDGNLNAIVDETIDATRHIVSTTLTTVAGFMPLLLLSGGDFWPPLAIVIAGGVGLSSLLSLIFTPAAYVLVRRALPNRLATPEALAARS